MRSSILIALLWGVIASLAVQPARAVIVLLKGQDEPLRGYLVRENDHVVVLHQLQADGSTKERTVSRSEIEDVIKTVDAARLEALRPENPDGYREYAEELAEKSKDPDARITALRLFLIAAHLQPQRLGRGCVLAMVPLARTAAEQRRFRAMAYLLDPTHDPQLLSLPRPPTTPPSDLEPRQAQYLLRALRLLRQGKQRDAATQARRVKLKERLHLLTDTITYKEFERACELTCPYCQRGRQPCPECQGNKFVLGTACAPCGATGEVACAKCGGDHRTNPLSPSLLKRIVQLELDWLPAEQPVDPPPTATRSAWSQSVQAAELDPLPPLTLEELTEFDPRENTFRDGQWSS